MEMWRVGDGRYIHMHIGATKMRFWKVRERIVMGVKRVGGEGESAVPTATS